MAKKKKRPDQRATFPKLQPDPIGGAVHPDYMRQLQELLSLGKAPQARGVGTEIFQQEKPLFREGLMQRPQDPFSQIDPHRLQMIQDLMRTEKLLKGI